MGRLVGIARHGRPRGVMETLDQVAVSREAGLAGDFRGAVKPGGRGRRQVSLIEARQWQAAMADLALDLHWSLRRANLCVDGFALPREEGAMLAIGESLVIEVTQECDPCSRMEEIAPGLRAALMPDWRGGALARVIEPGRIALGDRIRRLA